MLYKEKLLFLDGSKTAKQLSAALGASGESTTLGTGQRCPSRALGIDGTSTGKTEFGSKEMSKRLKGSSHPGQCFGLLPQMFWLCVIKWKTQLSFSSNLRRVLSQMTNTKPQ